MAELTKELLELLEKRNIIQAGLNEIDVQINQLIVRIKKIERYK